MKKLLTLIAWGAIAISSWAQNIEIRRAAGGVSSNDFSSYSNYVATNFTSNATFMTYTNFVLTNFATSNSLLSLSNYVRGLTVTNTGQGISLINNSNQQAFTFKSLTNGANVTLTDNGTNISIAATGGGGGGSTLTANVILPYTDGTNVLIDFNEAPCFGTNSQATYWHTVTTNSFYIFTNIPTGLTNWEFVLQIKYTTNIFTVGFDTNTVQFPGGVGFQATQNSNKVDLLTGIKSILTNTMNVTYANDFTR